MKILFNLLYKVLLPAGLASLFLLTARYFLWDAVAEKVVPKSGVRVNDFMETYYSNNILIIAGVSLLLSLIWLFYAYVIKVVKSSKKRRGIRGVWLSFQLSTLICPLILMWIYIRGFLRVGGGEWDWLWVAAVYVLLSVLIFYVVTFFSAPPAHKYAPVFSRTLKF